MIVSDSNRLDEVDCHLAEALGRHGYAILRFRDTGATILTRLANRLGGIQPFRDADPSGIFEVRPRHFTDESARGSGFPEFLPHTDGAFLDGWEQRNGKIVPVGPPALTLLQCVIPGAAGGTTLLVDGQAVMADTARDHPDLLEVLTQPEAFAFHYRGEAVLNVPLLAQQSDGTWRIRFRLDAMYAKLWARDAAEHFVREYLLSERYVRRCHLKAGDLLVADNYRVLHGRTRIPSEDRTRFLRRVWIRAPAEQEFNPMTPNECDADEHRPSYMRPPELPVRLGIKEVSYRVKKRDQC